MHLKQPRAGDAWLVARLDEIFHHPDKKRNIAQPRAGDAPFAQVVMRLTLYLASGDEGQQEQNCSCGDVPNSQVRVMLKQ